MIIISTKPYTKVQIERLKERYEVYIKTVMDVEKRICAAGMAMHYEGEQKLLKQGSQQGHLWGGGIDTETNEIDFNSFINIRPPDNNPRNEILDPKLRQRYKELTEYFFREIL